MEDQDTTEELEEEVLQKEQELRERELRILENNNISYAFPENFLQKDMQKYQTRLTKLGDKDEIAISVYKGLIVRVAVELGWLSGSPVEDISNMTPGMVTLISNIVFQDILVANRIPNE